MGFVKTGGYVATRTSHEAAILAKLRGALTDFQGVTY
jgi:hypothetical protein